MGWIVVTERLADIDGDGSPEALVVEGRLKEGPEPERMRVGFWTRSDGDWALRYRTDERPGNRVGHLEFGSIGCGAIVALVEIVEESPDEIRRELLVFDGGQPVLKEALASRGAHRDPALLDASFLSAPLGFSRDAGGKLRLGEKPVIVELPGPKGERRAALLGATFTELGCSEGRLVRGASSFEGGDGLKRTPTGPAGDGSPATGLHPARGKRLEIEGVAGGRMLRLVPGCAGGEAEWKRRGQVQRIRLSGPLAPIDIDLQAEIPVTHPSVRASGLLPLGGAPWARQLLVIFERPLPEGTLAIEVVGTSGAGCIAEVEIL